MDRRRLCRRCQNRRTIFASSCDPGTTESVSTTLRNSSTMSAGVQNNIGSNQNNIRWFRSETLLDINNKIQLLFPISCSYAYSMLGTTLFILFVTSIKFKIQLYLDIYISV